MLFGVLCGDEDDLGRGTFRARVDSRLPRSCKNTKHLNSSSLELVASCYFYHSLSLGISICFALDRMHIILIQMYLLTLKSSVHTP